MQREEHIIGGLLQGLEHSLELSERLIEVVRQFIAAHHEGRSLNATTVAEYEQQLRTVDEQRAQAQAAIAVWWALIGRDQPQ